MIFYKTLLPATVALALVSSAQAAEKNGFYAAIGSGFSVGYSPNTKHNYSEFFKNSGVNEEKYKLGLSGTFLDTSTGYQHIFGEKGGLLLAGELFGRMTNIEGDRKLNVASTDGVFRFRHNIKLKIPYMYGGAVKIGMVKDKMAPYMKLGVGAAGVTFKSDVPDYTLVGSDSGTLVASPFKVQLKTKKKRRSKRVAFFMPGVGASFNISQFVSLEAEYGVAKLGKIKYYQSYTDGTNTGRIKNEANPWIHTVMLKMKVKFCCR
ncbi:MAG: hypothetical protein ACK5O7_04660 [Holosporales bacterium]